VARHPGVDAERHGVTPPTSAADELHTQDHAGPEMKPSGRSFYAVGAFVQRITIE
jgi:hypothetical protein